MESHPTITAILSNDWGPHLTMGIRPNEADWKHRVNDLIATHRDENDNLITK